MDNLITKIDIREESKDNFLTYAEAVLTDRAIPNAEDGLLSSQRKILWTCEELMKLTNKDKPKKSATIVGQTLSSSYEHGDIACYGVLCKMAQPYLMRYPLIDGDNLGSQEANDMQASSRYTSSKPSKYSDLMMLNYKKNIVPTKLTYTEEYYEPVFLPGFFPNALVNGKEAIAVGMAHNSSPNNLSEVCDAIIAYLNNNNITIDEIMQYMKGPDYPLGGTVVNGKDIKQAYLTGKSEVSLKVRGDYTIKDNEVIFTSIPFRTYRSNIRAQITANADELDKYFEDFRDESNLGVNRLIFEFKPGVDKEFALNMLFAKTDLQTSISYNMNYIVDGTPKLCGIIDLIKAYVNHQHNCMIKAAEFDKDKAEKRKHIIEGLLLIIDGIDKAIQLIRNSNDKKEAKEKLIQNFPIDDIQAEAILEMKLARLTKLEKDDLLNELQEKIDIINESTKIINEQEYRVIILKDKIKDLKKNYGDERRTKIIDIVLPDSSKSKIQIQKEPVIITVNKNTTINYTPAAQYTKPRANSKAAKNMLYTLETQSTDNILLFTAGGKYYNIPAYKIQTNEIDLDGDRVVVIKNMPVNKQYYITMTKNGLVKKSLLKDISKATKITGSAACKIKDGDELVSVDFCNDNDFVLLVSSSGKGIKVLENEFALQGKATTGCKGITIKKGDYLEIGKCFTPKDKEYKYGRTTIKFSDYDYASKATIGLMMI